jgi:hypothetical protein
MSVQVVGRRPAAADCQTEQRDRARAFWAKGHGQQVGVAVFSPHVGDARGALRTGADSHELAAAPIPARMWGGSGELISSRVAALLPADR